MKTEIELFENALDTTSVNGKKLGEYINENYISNSALNKIIDDFVEFLIRENCEGCELCEPRLAAQWKPNFACVNEGWTKWLLDEAEKYKASKKGA